MSNIEQLMTEAFAELHNENATLRAQLAASQAEAARLRGACGILLGWADSFLMDDHPAVVRARIAIADAAGVSAADDARGDY